MAYKLFDENSATHTEKEINSENQKLAEELHKTIIRNSKKRRLYSPLKITFGMEINQIRN